MKTKRYIFLTLITFLMLTFVANSFAQDETSEYVVRAIYFHAKDIEPHPNVEVEFDQLLKDAQQFYADEMKRHGFSRKTFRLETDRTGKIVVHRVNGQFASSHYQTSTNVTRDVLSEIRERFDDTDEDIEVGVFNEITGGFADTDNNIEIVLADCGRDGGGVAAGESALIFSSNRSHRSHRASKGN